MTQIDEIESIKIEFDAAALAVNEFALMLRRELIAGRTMCENDIAVFAEEYVKQIDADQDRAIAYVKHDVPLFQPKIVGGRDAR